MYLLWQMAAGGVYIVLLCQLEDDITLGEQGLQWYSQGGSYVADELLAYLFQLHIHLLQGHNGCKCDPHVHVQPLSCLSSFMVKALI